MRHRIRCLPAAILVLLVSVRVLIAQPDETKGPWRTPDLVELVKIDSTVRLDVRYATTNNFMKMRMYSEARAFLQRPAANALVHANRKLHEQGFGILVFDGYRPWAVTKKFWDATPQSKRKFVANPRKGSKHNRGCAVDCSLYDLKTGNEVTMPSPFDDFTEKAAADYGGGTPEQRRTRGILRAALDAEGFAVNPDEWWHFDYKDWKKYRVLNVPFEKIP